MFSSNIQILHVFSCSNLCMGISAHKRISVIIKQETPFYAGIFPVFLCPYFPRRTIFFCSLFITKSLFSFIMLESSEGTGEILPTPLSRNQSVTDHWNSINAYKVTQEV